MFVDIERRQHSGRATSIESVWALDWAVVQIANMGRMVEVKAISGSYAASTAFQIAGAA